MAKKANGKIDNLEEIEARTGYKPGQLYYGSIDNKIDCYMGTKESQKSTAPGTGVIFDVDTYNFHMIPDNVILSQIISDLLKIRRQSLVQCWNDNNYFETLSGLKLMSSWGSGGNIKNICANTEKYNNKNCHLFHFLLFKKDDKYYFINLMRFFVDEKKQINCILACLQFDCCYGTSNVNEGKKKKGEKKGPVEICFPTNYEVSVSINKNTKKYNIHPNSRKNFSYNPDIAFDSEPKEIIKAFLRFVQEVEESEKNKD